MFSQEIFIEREKSLRKMRGMNKTQMAAALSISRQSVSAWEKGERLPSFDVLCRLAEYFGVSTDYLLGREGEGEEAPYIPRDFHYPRDPRCFYKPVEIRFCDCDRHKRARVQTLLKIMADIAGVAYADRGYSHAWLWEHQSVFLLTRAAIRVRRMPIADETIVVETWETGIKGAQYYRDFTFFDREGNRIVEGQTAWVVVDPISRTIQKPSAFPGHFEPIPDKVADTLPPARLKPEGEFLPQGERTIVYSDIDGNGHTYNAVYGGIACDFLPAEWMESRLTDFRINFKQEALLGETLTIQTSLHQNHAFVVGRLGETISFECEFLFAEMAEE